MRPRRAGEEQPRGPAVDGAVLETRLADGRRVDQRHHLLDVIDDEPVEKHLVAVLEVGEVDVLLERIGLAADGREAALHLLFEREDPRRQQAAQSRARRVRAR
jgi:hypothetical protein